MQNKLKDLPKMTLAEIKDKERLNLKFEIECLRDQIRIDMKDYQLLNSDDNNGNYYFPIINLDSTYCWFENYLKQKIKDNLTKLEKLIIKQNTQELEVEQSEKLHRNCCLCNKELNKDNRCYDNTNLCKHCVQAWEKMSNE